MQPGNRGAGAPMSQPQSINNTRAIWLWKALSCPVHSIIRWGAKYSFEGRLGNLAWLTLHTPGLDIKTFRDTAPVFLSNRLPPKSPNALSWVLLWESVRFSTKRRQERLRKIEFIVLTGPRNRTHAMQGHVGKHQRRSGDRDRREERGVSLGPGLYQFLHSAGKARQGRVMTWDWLARIIPAGPRLKEFPGCLDYEGRGMLLSGGLGPDGAGMALDW